VILFKDHPSDDYKDRMVFRYGKGLATTKADFGDPTTSTSYAFCLYKESVPTPLRNISIPAGGTCANQPNNRPCWKETRAGFKYKELFGSNDGVQTLLLKEGTDGRAKIVIRGRGLNVAPPDLSLLDARLTAQVVSSSGVCWGAEFPQPPRRQTSDVYSDKGE
jgi:hypothetical protein